MIVDDPYMVRIEAIQQLGRMGDDFSDMVKAWRPNGEMPSLRDLFAIGALNILGNELFRREASNTPQVIAEFAYDIADAMLKARKP